MNYQQACGGLIVLLRLRGRKGVGNTVLQQVERLERANEIERLTRAFIRDQQWIMPKIHAARMELEGVDDVRDGSLAEDDDGGEEDDTEKRPLRTPLYLPSELPLEAARTLPLELRLEELRLHFIAMGDRKADLCAQLQVQASVILLKKTTIRGQRGMTRANDKQVTISNNVALAKHAYRFHRERALALISQLDSAEQVEYVPEEWEETYRELKDEDCRPLSANLLLHMEQVEMQHLRNIVASRKKGKSSGQSAHRISWIWFTLGEGEDLELNDGEDAADGERRGH